MQKKNTAIPVVMYHSVGRPIPNWKWSYLTVPVSQFNNHLKCLFHAGYKTVDLYELYAHVSGKNPLPSRSVVLTFDDGYLDNWIYVAPLLARYGMKATVFVNPEFVDPRDIVRPTIKDVWNGKLKENELEMRGFMSWPELKKLVEEKTFDIQSHAMSHTWYPLNSEIIDFSHPDDGYYWLRWNTDSAEKPFYLLDPGKTVVPFGTPIYEHEKSLAVRRFFPDNEENLRLSAFVKKKGGDKFFQRKDWRDELFLQAAKIRKTYETLGRYETIKDQINRYNYELVLAKRIIEKRIGSSVDFFCWPGGTYNDISLKIALENYIAITLGFLGRTSPIRNRFGDDPRMIQRIGVPMIEYRNKFIYPAGRYFVQYLKEYQGSVVARRYRQLLKLFGLFNMAMRLV